MRYYASIATALLLGGSLLAQNEVMYVGSVQFTSRGNIGTGFGEIHQGFHNVQWRALGKQGMHNSGAISAFRGNAFQDQNRGTVELYNWVVREGSVAKGPTTGTGGMIFKSSDQSLPTLTGTTPVAWNITTTLITPVLVPCDDFFSVGVYLPTEAAWTRDGHSVWAQAAAQNLASAKLPDMAWQIIGAATAATHPSAKRAWRIGFIQMADTLQAGRYTGTGAAAYSHAGHAPRPGTDSLAFRVRAQGKNGQIAVIFRSNAFIPKCLQIFGGGWALPTTDVLAGGPIANNVFQVRLGAIPASAKDSGDSTYQALILDVSKLQLSLTNAFKITL